MQILLDPGGPDGLVLGDPFSSQFFSRAALLVDLKDHGVVIGIVQGELGHHRRRSRIFRSKIIAVDLLRLGLSETTGGFLDLSHASISNVLPGVRQTQIIPAFSAQGSSLSPSFSRSTSPKVLPPYMLISLPFMS